MNRIRRSRSRCVDHGVVSRGVGIVAGGIIGIARPHRRVGPAPRRRRQPGGGRLGQGRGRQTRRDGQRGRQQKAIVLDHFGDPPRFRSPTADATALRHRPYLFRSASGIQGFFRHRCLGRRRLSRLAAKAGDLYRLAYSPERWMGPKNWRMSSHELDEAGDCPPRAEAAD